MPLILNYDKSVDAADQFFLAPSIDLFFAVSPTRNAAKKIGVPPLLRIESATVAVTVAVTIAVAVSLLQSAFNDQTPQFNR